MVTLEEAERCPKCSEPGEFTKATPGAKGSSVRNYMCRNTRCKWYNTGWIVQVMSDGTIPERKNTDKDFAPLTPGQEAMARMVIEDAIQSDLREQ